MQFENGPTVWKRPAGPFGSKKCPILSAIPGAAVSGLFRATKSMLAPFNVQAIVSARNARLLLLSSQARPPSSHAANQNSFTNSAAAKVSLLLSATLPLSSTSTPPKDHNKG